MASHAPVSNGGEGMTLTTLNRQNPHIESWLRPMTDRLWNGDYVALILNYNEGFTFNDDEAWRLNGKKFVCFEMGEYGVDQSWQNTYLPAVNVNAHRPVCNVEERYKLDEFLKSQNIVLTFKREFSANIQQMIDEGRVHYPVEPIEIFFDNIPPIPDLNHDEYVNRVGLIFHLFGNSHPDRKNLAGFIMAGFERICTSIGKQADLVNHRLPFHHVEQVEACSRYAVQDVLHHQGNCLLSVNLPGFGQKSFRMREACFNAVPVMGDYGVHYSIPWNDDNAVMLPTVEGRLKIPESIRILQAVLRDRENLWHRVQNANTLARMYHPDRYVEEQINQKIQAVL